MGPKPQGMAIGSMVCGIISCVLFCAWYIAIPCGIVAIILAVLARKQIAAGQAEGEGKAKAGLICGIIGIALSAIIGIAAIVFVTKFGDKIQQLQQQQMQQQRSRSTSRY
jgi:hypothetical protein